MTKSPVDHLTRPVSRFIRLEYTSGLILFLAVVLAIVWVNSPLADWYHHVWNINFTVGFGQEKLSHSLHDWINDGLMAIFFFVIGLELQREFIAGELSSLKKAVLPMFGALGGMIVPAAIYAIFNHDIRFTRLGYTNGDRYRFCPGHTFYEREPYSLIGQDLSFGAGGSRRPGCSPGHRIFLHRRPATSTIMDQWYFYSRAGDRQPARHPSYSVLYPAGPWRLGGISAFRGSRHNCRRNCCLYYPCPSKG